MYVHNNIMLILLLHKNTTVLSILCNCTSSYKVLPFSYMVIGVGAIVVVQSVTVKEL